MDEIFRIKSKKTRKATTGSTDYSAFCRLARQMTKHLTLRQLSEKTGLKPGRLFKILNIDDKKRGVERHIVEAIAGAADNATEEQREDLFIRARHKYVRQNVLEELNGYLAKVLHNPDYDDPQKDEFMDWIKSRTDRWMILQEIREKEINLAVCAAAGWQSRLFHHLHFQRTLLPSLAEAAEAGITRIILVVPPNTPEIKVIRGVFGGVMTIEMVQQEQPLGLGHALFVSRSHIKDAAFALILPDDIDETRLCLKQMVRLYGEVKKPMIAVEPGPLTDESPEVTGTFGIAALSTDQVPCRSKQLFYVKGGLIEKPQGVPIDENARRIAGRYIFTPELLDALVESPGVNSGLKKYDLTSGINRLWAKSNALCAYKLDRPMSKLAPVKQMIRKLESNEIFNPDSYEVQAQK